MYLQTHQTLQMNDKKRTLIQGLQEYTTKRKTKYEDKENMPCDKIFTVPFVKSYR